MTQERSALPTIWDADPNATTTDQSALIGKKPNKIIPVPDEYRRQTLARERDTLVNDLKNGTGCHVVPRWDQGKISSFNVYGSGLGLERAVTRLYKWISDAHVKSVGASAWAKMPAYDRDKWYYEQVEEWEHEQKQQFKGPVPTEESGRVVPRYSTIVDWPEDLTNESVTPRDAFGNKLEKLDGLRMQDKVYITLPPPTLDEQKQEQWHIQMIGYELEIVEVAREHLNTMIEQVRIKASGVRHTLNKLLDWREGIDVDLQENEHWWPNHTDKVVPHLSPSAMMDQPGSFRQEALHLTDLLAVEKSLRLALDNIRHRHGVYDFVVRLGCVALNSKHVSADRIGQTLPKDQFMKQINGPIDIDVKKWLANYDAGCSIVDRLLENVDFLEPTRSTNYYGYTPATLEDTRPTLRGIWVFKDPSSVAARLPREPPRNLGRPTPLNNCATPVKESTPISHTNLFVVQIDWTDDEEGMYEKGTPIFYKVEDGLNGPKKNMDINLLELGESRGWHFALESLDPLSSNVVPPSLTGFAQRVTIKKNYKAPSIGNLEDWDCKSFAEWEQTATVKKYLQIGRLDSIYSFGVQKTCYKVELTAMWYPGQKLPVWGLAVRHAEWATHLAELERLSIGRQASWGDTIGTFIPDNGQYSGYADDDEELDMRKLNLHEQDEAPRDGIRILTDKLMKLSEIVSSVTAAGGVRV